jgi:hypothetical protein
VNTFASQNPQYGQAFLDTVLAAFKTVPGGALIVAGKLRLSKDPAFAPTPQSLIADLTPEECDFSGYTAGGYGLTLSAPVNLSTTVEGVLAGATAIATTASPFVANNVYGYWVDDGANVVLSEAFGAAGPIPIGAAGDFAQVDLRLPVGYVQPAA